MDVTKLCKRGHLAARTAKAECVECKRLNSAAHYRANSQVYKDRAAEWHGAQPKGWRDAAHARYRTEHKDTRHAYGRAWNKLNAEKKRAYTRNRKAAKRNAGVHTVDDVRTIKASQSDACFYCESPLTAEHVDHFIALSRGGSNERWNIVVACAECNMRKSDKAPAVFMNFALKVPYFWIERDLSHG